MALEKYQGVIPALYTPFDKSGELNPAIVPKQLDFLKRAGCTGLFVGGSSGEGFYQSTEERARHAEVVVKEAGGEMDVVVHVAAMDLREAVFMAKNAEQIGAAGVASVAPFYYPQTVDMMRAYYQKIAEATDLPFLLYWLGTVTTPIKPEQFVDAFADLPNIFGAKFTIADLYIMQMVSILSDGKLKTFGGYDQMSLPALVMGAAGNIGNNFNHIPEVYVRLYNAFKSGDLQGAIAIQRDANEMLAKMRAFGVHNMGKASMCLRGIDVGTVRLPKLPLSEDSTAKLRAIMEEYGIIPGDDEEWLRI